jgi:hypothetical protein
VLASQLLARFSGANNAAFKALKTSQLREFGDRKVAAGTSLDDLANKSVDVRTSSAVLEAVFDELAQQTQSVSLVDASNVAQH